MALLATNVFHNQIPIVIIFQSGFDSTAIHTFRVGPFLKAKLIIKKCIYFFNNKLQTNKVEEEILKAILGKLVLKTDENYKLLHIALIQKLIMTVK